MLVEEIYKELMKRPNSNSLLNSFIDLRTKARNEGNTEYYFLATLKLSDIYLDLADLDKALSVLIPLKSEIDKKKYRGIYFSLIERLIYLYIQKGSFSQAAKYIFEKREYISENDYPTLSRWYLEMGFVYTKQNEIQNAINCYQSIIAISVDAFYLSYAYSNLARIYIEQNLISDAKIMIEKCTEVTSDSEGKAYIIYLKAKLAIANKDYDGAMKLFDELLANGVKFDYFSIANEYLAFLMKVSEYNKAASLIEMMEKTYDSLSDLDVKKEYLANKLKVYSHKYNDNLIIRLLNDIESLDKTIAENNKNSEADQRNDERIEEVNKSLSMIIDKVEKINSIDFRYKDNIRDFLILYLSKLELIVGFNKFYLIDLDDNTSPFSKDKDKFKVYDYSNKRLYERSITIDKVDSTIIEDAIINNTPQYYDLSIQGENYLDFIKGETYATLEISGYASAYPIVKEEKLKYICIMMSKFFDFSVLENTIITNICVNRIVDAYSNIKNSEGLRYFTQVSSILCDMSLCVIHKNNQLYINKGVAKILGIETDREYFPIEYDKYLSIASELSVDYKSEFSNTDALKKDVTYTIKLNGEHKKVSEVATLLTLDNSSFYFSVLSIEDYTSLTEESNTSLTFDSIDKEKNYTIACLNKLSSEKTVEVRKMFGTTVVNQYGHNFIFIDANVSMKIILAFLNEINEKYAVLKYPSDVKEFASAISVSLYMIDNDKSLFSNEIYKDYLTFSLTSEVFNDNLPSSNICFLQNPEGLVFLALNVRGISDAKSLRDNLSQKDKQSFDRQIISHLSETGIDEYFMYLSVSLVSELLKINSNFTNITFLMDSYDSMYHEELVKFSNRMSNVYLYYQDLKNIDALSLASLNIKGIYEKDHKYAQDAKEFAEKINLLFIFVGAEEV